MSIPALRNEWMLPYVPKQTRERKGWKKGLYRVLGS